MAKNNASKDDSALNGLTEVQRALIEGYALLHPERPARTKMLGWLNRLRKTEGKTGFTSEELRAAIESLIAAGLLLPSASGQGVVAQGPTVVPGLVSPGCLTALALNHAYPMLAFAIDEYEYMFTRFSARQLPNAPGQLELLLQDHVYEFRLLEQFTRLEVLSGQFDASLEARLPDNIWNWMVEPTAHPYLIELPDRLRQTICLSGMYRLCVQLQPAGPFRKLCLQHAPDPVQLAGIAATTLILEGDFAQAMTLLDTYAERARTAHQEKFLQVARYSNEALIATLTADAAGARKKVEACLDAERAGTRKRNVFPLQPAFEIAILGLMLEGSPQSSRMFKTLTKSYGKLPHSMGMESVYKLVLHATEEHFVSTPHYRESTCCLVDLLLALSSRWNDKFNLKVGHDNFVHSLQLLLQQAHIGGYQWVVAELLFVLEASALRDAQRLPSTSELMAINRSSDMHRQMGSTSLATLIKPLQAWEKNLRNLESLVPADEAAKAVQKKAKAVSKKRVVWQLLEADSFALEVVPLEQSLGKSGWSSGRRISLQRLKNNPDQVAGLSTTDHKAAATIRKMPGYGWGNGSARYETDSRTVFQLIGHASVIDENGEAVEVIERPAELRIAEKGDSVLLQIHPRSGGQHYVATFDADESQTPQPGRRNRVYVTHFNAAQRRLFDVIPQGGMELPAAARSRLLEVVASLSADIQVQSDSTDVGATSIDGDATPVLQLDIVDGSVQVRFKVEPLAGSAVLYDSGVGGVVIYVRHNGTSAAVRRDLQAEQDQMHLLLNQVPSLALWFDGRHSANIDNIPDALEMLEVVQQRNVRCIWVNDKRLAISASADSSQLRLKIKSAEQWFSASGELRVNEHAINLARLISMAKSQPGSRFVEVGSGEFVSLSSRLRSQLQVLAAFSKASADEDGVPVQKLHPLAAVALGPQMQQASLSQDDQVASRGVADQTTLPLIDGDEHWNERIGRVREAFATPPELPGTVQADLRHYQLQGFRWLSQLGRFGAGACLADDMGLGKTLQSLSVLVERATAGAALVIAPTSVAGNWIEEAQRFAPTLNVSLYAEQGSTRKTRQESLAELGKFSVLIASYGLLVSDAQAFAQVHWHTVVLDEAQAIKNAATKRAKAARQLQADMRIATTGTPIQNNLMDLHSIFDFLNPGVLGTRNEFHQRFAIPVERDGNADAREELQVLTAPFILRRLKRDVLKDLPPRTEINLSVELSEEEATLYETLRLEALDALTTESAASESQQSETQGSDAQPQRFAILAQLMRLRRFCCNPKLIDATWSGRQSKLDLFNDTLQELLANRHKVLVFSQFVDHLQLIEAELEKNEISYQYLDGSTPARQRQQRVTAFQSGEGEVFLISLTAGGTGLNLTAADFVIHLDPWWNPAVEDQASDRAHRIGQKRPVTIYRMVTKGTVEAQIQELHGNKRELAQSILSGRGSTKVDPERLLELLTQPLEKMISG